MNRRSLPIPDVAVTVGMYHAAPVRVHVRDERIKPVALVVVRIGIEKSRNRYICNFSKHDAGLHTSPTTWRGVVCEPADRRKHDLKCLAYVGIDGQDM